MGTLYGVRGIESFASNLAFNFEKVMDAHASGTTHAIHNYTLKLNASNSSSIYGNSTTVQPKSLIFNYVIKY